MAAYHHLKSCLWYGLLALVVGVIAVSDLSYAQTGNEAEDGARDTMSYTKALFMNQCSQDYYAYFNPGDKLNAKGRQQMVNHIKASCQCLYKNLNKVFSENGIMQYIQSQHVSSQTAQKYYGKKHDQVYDLLTSEELREKCHHLNDMGATYGEDD